MCGNILVRSLGVPQFVFDKVSHKLALAQRTILYPTNNASWVGILFPFENQLLK